PQAADRARESLARGALDGLNLAVDLAVDGLNLERARQGPVAHRVQRGRDAKRGEEELVLERLLDVLLALDGSQVRRDEADDHADEDAQRGDDERQHERGPARHDNALGGMGNDEAGASGLGEGAEEVAAGTGDVTDVVADVV